MIAIWYENQNANQHPSVNKNNIRHDIHAFVKTLDIERVHIRKFKHVLLYHLKFHLTII